MVLQYKQTIICIRRHASSEGNRRGFSHSRFSEPQSKHVILGGRGGGEKGGDRPAVQIVYKQAFLGRLCCVTVWLRILFMWLYGYSGNKKYAFLSTVISKTMAE